VTPDRRGSRRQPTARDPPPTTDQPRSAACAHARPTHPPRLEPLPGPELRRSPYGSSPPRSPSHGQSSSPPHPAARASPAAHSRRWRSFNSPANTLNFSPIAASSATRSRFYDREPQSCNVIYLRALRGRGRGGRDSEAALGDVAEIRQALLDRGILPHHARGPATARIDRRLQRPRFSYRGSVTTRRVVLPERLTGTDGLVLRRWLASDAGQLGQAILESAVHLRPWMAWIAEEPLPLHCRIAMINEWERDWAQGGDVVLGVFLAGRIAGGCGLHRRIGADGLEIGYWTHTAFLRRGVGTRVARVLTDAGLAVPGITRVEIHYDKANQASAGIPRGRGARRAGRAGRYWGGVALANGQGDLGCSAGHESTRSLRLARVDVRSAALPG
jgi:ribosomal-protein-serine acetyltransferase